MIFSESRTPFCGTKTLSTQSRAGQAFEFPQRLRKIAPRIKIDTIRELIGDGLTYREYPGNEHATLTKHRQPEALKETIRFLSERLGVAA